MEGNDCLLLLRNGKEERLLIKSEVESEAPNFEALVSLHLRNVVFKVHIGYARKEIIFVGNILYSAVILLGMQWIKLKPMMSLQAHNRKLNESNNHLFD